MGHTLIHSPISTWVKGVLVVVTWVGCLLEGLLIPTKLWQGTNNLIVWNEGSVSGIGLEEPVVLHFAKWSPALPQHTHTHKNYPTTKFTHYHVLYIYYSMAQAKRQQIKSMHNCIPKNVNISHQSITLAHQKWQKGYTVYVYSILKQIDTKLYILYWY